MGAYHTLDLEMNRKFTLQKSEWDSVALERIGKSCFRSVALNYRITSLLLQKPT